MGDFLEISMAKEGCVYIFTREAEKVWEEEILTVLFIQHI